VDAREGTVTGPGGTVRLEPKVMDVLTTLASQPGRVVSRDELLEKVWPDVIVTEHTLSRCIYQLRHSLNDVGPGADQSDFKPIETLPKRGYRLLAAVETRDAVSSWSPDNAGMAVLPFVVGQWVRGERFYGRTTQISEILDGPRNCIWLLGTRRIGKTSLLKQVEFIAESDADRHYMPIFWDFQGASTPGELHLNFADALLDADERLARVGISLADVEADDLFVSLELLRRQLRARNLKLLLLCDEVEELIGLHRQDASLLRKLRHTMQSREDIRTVLASTIRLWALAEHKDDTSPFLHGFAPPLYIERLPDAEARALIEQSHLDAGQRPRYAEGVIESIQRHCDNHPYLVQLVCKRYFETGELDDAIEQVATDRMVSYFFSVDFEMLSAAEDCVVRIIAGQSGATRDAVLEECSLSPDLLDSSLQRLQNLGFIRSTGPGRYELANYFFRRWLQAMQAPSTPSTDIAPLPQDIDEERTVPDEIDVPPSTGFFAELKRRNVFRVGLAYIVVAWLMLQFAEILFQFLEVPNWAGKLLIAFLIIGLPFALVLAWAFELTPDGLKRDSEIRQAAVATQRPDRRFDWTIIVLLAIAVLIYAYDKIV
jgi:DNA-binding winged helix-turn-helix (wHTH) protein